MLKCKRILSAVAITTLTLNLGVVTQANNELREDQFSTLSFNGSYAYSIGVNHGWFGEYTGDFTENVDYASTVYGMISNITSYKNHTPDVDYMRGNNPSGVRRIGSDIVFLNGHANYTNLIFNHSNDGGNYKTGVYYGEDYDSSSTGYKYVGIQSTDMSGVDLISFVGCKTGANNGTNLGSRACDAGATTAVAFTEEINSRNTKGPEWLQKYHDALGSGDTVEEAINYATTLYPQSTLGDSVVIYGDSDNTIVFGRSTQVSMELPTITTIPFEMSIAEMDNMKDVSLEEANINIKDLTEKIKKIDSTFNELDYKITVNNYTDNSGIIILSYFINNEIETNKAYTIPFDNGVTKSINYVNRISQYSYSEEQSTENTLVERVNDFKTVQVSRLSIDNETIERYYYDYDSGELTYVYSKYTEEPELGNVIVESGEEVVIP